MSRRDRRSSAASQGAPAPDAEVSDATAADDSLGTDAPPPKPSSGNALSVCVAPPSACALCTIHAGATYAPGDRIPNDVAAQLSEGVHWRREV